MTNESRLFECTPNEEEARRTKFEDVGKTENRIEQFISRKIHYTYVGKDEKNIDTEIEGGDIWVITKGDENYYGEDQTEAEFNMRNGITKHLNYSKRSDGICFDTDPKPSLERFREIGRETIKQKDRENIFLQRDDTQRRYGFEKKEQK